MYHMYIVNLIIFLKSSLNYFFAGSYSLPAKLCFQSSFPNTGYRYGVSTGYKQNMHLLIKTSRVLKLQCHSTGSTAEMICFFVKGN